MRKQIAFASLTNSEIQQIADSLESDTYDAVLTRICKPRSEGGYGLDISRSPLERLWAKRKKLKEINAHIAAGEKLTLAQLESIEAAEAPASQEAHDAIMCATHRLASSDDNTPAQLLALQRLADFPARAELRAERLGFARAAQERAQEMHIHRITLDLRKQNHKESTAAFRQKIASERLNLRRHPAPDLNPIPTVSASPSPLLRGSCNRDENPCENSQHLKISPPDDSESEINGQKPEIEPLSEAEIAALIPRVISPRPLPPQVIAANLRYAEKVRTGKIIIDRSGHYLTAIEVPDKTDTVEKTESRVTPLNDQHPLHLTTQEQTLTAISNQIPNLSPSSANSELSPTPCNAQAAKLADPDSTLPPSPSDLAATVDTYTVNRVREYIAHNQRYSPWPHRHSPPEYITQFRHCPCGHACPCPTHESEEFGPFPNIFWKLTPFSLDYAACLRDRNLPYREPREYLP